MVVDGCEAGLRQEGCAFKSGWRNCGGLGCDFLLVNVLATFGDCPPTYVSLRYARLMLEASFTSISCVIRARIRTATSGLTLANVCRLRGQSRRVVKLLRIQMWRVLSIYLQTVEV